jgi:endo-1,4-beta-D-glucanase Y
MENAYAVWRFKFFKDCGSEAFILKDDETPNVAVSIAIGYGMLITAALGKKEDFAKLAAYYLARRDSNGFMNWKYQATCDGRMIGSSATTDAEIDVAMAFIIADKAGFGGTYLADAKAIISQLSKDSSGTIKQCSPGKLLMVGDEWGSCSQLNPSYLSPGHFHTFAKITGDTSWDEVASASYTLLAKYQANFNGFVPEWGNDGGLAVTNPNAPGTPVGLYGYEACRMPWRIALDYGWHQSASAKTFLKTFNTKVIVAQGGLPSGVVANKNWGADYEKNSCHVGGYALVGTSIDQATADAYFRDWRDAHLFVDEGTAAHYMETMKLLYLITAGGRLDSGL